MGKFAMMAKYCWPPCTSLGYIQWCKSDKRILHHSPDMNNLSAGGQPGSSGPSSMHIQHEMTKLLQLTHKQWLFWNSHVNHKKIEGMTTAQHEQIFGKVKSMICEQTRWICWQNIATYWKKISNSSARAHPRSGNNGLTWWNWRCLRRFMSALEKKWGEPSTFAPTRHARTTITLKLPSSGSYVYRQSRTAKRTSGGIS